MESLEEIIAQMPCYFYWLDKNNVFQGCNNLMAEALGCSKEDIIGKKSSDLILNSSFRKSLHRNNMRTMVMKTFGVFEEPLVLQNGQKITLLSHKRPFFDEQNNFIGLMNVSIEITYENKLRKRMERELKIANEIAEISNKAKTEFLENMKHDIRTPLSGIIGLAELIQHEVNPEKIRSYNTQLVKSSRELLEFLNNILDSINVASGEIPLVKRRFNLQRVLEKVLSLNRAKAIEKNLNLELIFDHHIPNSLLGDDVRIYRVILEMLCNALKFTQQGYVRISAKLIKSEQQNIVIKIEVEDSGPGVPIEIQEELFIRFKRLLPSYQGIYKGTGLGLFTVKQFVDDLQGELYYSDSHKNGAKFILVLPLKQSLLEDIPNSSVVYSVVSEYLKSSHG